MVENRTITILVIGMVSLIVGIIIAFTLVQNVRGIYEDVDPDTTESATQSILTNSLAILSPVAQGFISGTSSATATNDSWMEFDGVNDGIDGTFNLDTNLSKGFSISIWMKTTEDDDNDLRDLINIDNLTGNFPEISLITRNQSGNKQQATLRIRGNSTCDLFSFTTRTNSIADNNWHNLIGVYNGTGVNLYFDSTLNATRVLTQMSSGCEDLFKEQEIASFNVMDIGDDSANYNGAMDELRYYNTTLSVGNITQIYNSGRQANSSLPSEGLVLWYSFNENSGQTIYDKSGNGNNGI